MYLTKNKCEQCGDLIVGKRPRDKNKRFCNRRCSSKFLFGKQKAKCNVCHKTVKKIGRIYCSSLCAGSKRRISHIRICQICGQKFKLKNIAYEKRGGGKCCSYECAKKVRKYSLDERYFSQVDTEQKAYWLGFLFADGYQDGHELVVNLSKKDKEHLEALKSALKSEHQIRDKDCVRKGVNKPISSFRVSSAKMCSDLNKLGCVKAKSLIIVFPDLSLDLVRHFIRGYFDGDGCISLNKKRKYTAKIIFYSGSKKFVDSLQDTLANFGMLLNRQKNRHFLTTGKREIICQLADFMYKDATVFLDRKRGKFNIVRKGHVKTDEHWLEKPMVINELADGVVL